MPATAASKVVEDASTTRSPAVAAEDRVDAAALLATAKGVACGVQVLSRAAGVERAGHALLLGGLAPGVRHVGGLGAPEDDVVPQVHVAPAGLEVGRLHRHRADPALDVADPRVLAAPRRRVDLAAARPVGADVEVVREAVGVPAASVAAAHVGSAAAELRHILGARVPIAAAPDRVEGPGALAGPGDGVVEPCRGGAVVGVAARGLARLRAPRLRVRADDHLGPGGIVCDLHVARDVRVRGAIQPLAVGDCLLLREAFVKVPQRARRTPLLVRELEGDAPLDVREAVLDPVAVAAVVEDGEADPVRLPTRVIPGCLPTAIGGLVAVHRRPAVEHHACPGPLRHVWLLCRVVEPGCLGLQGGPAKVRVPTMHRLGHPDRGGGLIPALEIGRLPRQGAGLQQRFVELGGHAAACHLVDPTLMELRVVRDRRLEVPRQRRRCRNLRRVRGAGGCGGGGSGRSGASLALVLRTALPHDAGQVYAAHGLAHVQGDGRAVEVAEVTKGLVGEADVGAEDVVGDPPEVRLAGLRYAA
mmetsp:Transcript_22119/g.65930  ORF Transcript_22119/g.65930 Transcript_22119/m.65930 type:complete len:531 (+) Transcript_22119:34-1626(+)